MKQLLTITILIGLGAVIYNQYKEATKNKKYTVK